MASGSISGVIWTAVVGGLALLGFIGLAVSAVMLKHKADDVMAEVTMVGQRVDELRTLVAQLELPPRSLK